jgi:hypothetical protein
MSPNRMETIRTGWLVHEFLLSIVYACAASTRRRPRLAAAKHLAQCLTHVYFFCEILESFRVEPLERLALFDSNMMFRMSIAHTCGAFLHLEAVRAPGRAARTILVVTHFLYRMACAFHLLLLSHMAADPRPGAHRGALIAIAMCYMVAGVLLAYVLQHVVLARTSAPVALCSMALLLRSCACIVGSCVTVSFLSYTTVYHVSAPRQLVLLAAFGSPFSVTFALERLVADAFGAHIERAVQAAVDSLHQSPGPRVPCPLCRAPAQDAAIRGGANDTCCICLDAPAGCMLLPCTHDSFCAPCVRRWFGRFGREFGGADAGADAGADCDTLVAVSGRRWRVSRGRFAQQIM